jgi:hypothetical protein
MDISHPENPEPPTTFIGIDFTCSYSPAGATDNAGAVFCTQGYIKLQYCNIYNNRSDGSSSGDGLAAGIGIRGGTYHIIDCNIYNNKAYQSGAGFRATSRDKRISCGAIERCYFGNNEVSSRYGGAIAFTAGDSHWIVNSTIVGNKALAEGAGVSLNASHFDANNKAGYVDERAVHIINSTIAGNICTGNTADLYEEGKNPGSWLGSQIRIEADPALEICNSIIVGKEDDGTIAKAALALKGSITSSTDAYINSYGGSILGTFAAVYEPTIKINWTADNMDGTTPITYAKVFGDTEVANNGGFTKTLIPRSTILNELDNYPLYGYEVGDYVDGLVKKGHTLPVEIDFTVDQTGEKRDVSENGETAPGAYDYLIKRSLSGIDNVAASAKAVSPLKAIGNNIWATTSGNDAAIAVYNLAGERITSVSASSIDLSAMAVGVYVITVDGTACKVLR